MENSIHWVEVGGGKFAVCEGRLLIDMLCPNSQCLPYFPEHNPDNPIPEAVLSYSESDNCVGHLQRSFLMYWAIRAFIESRGMSSVDFGSAGISHFGTLSVDKIGTGEVSSYEGSPYSGVNIKGDASKLENYGTNSFSAAISSHCLEHVPLCTEIPDAFQNDPRYKIQRRCPGKEIIPILREWIRIVRPGGYVACCLPDDMAAQRAGSSVFFEDKTHQHAPDSRTFRQLILEPLTDLVEIILYDTYNTNFSFCFVLRKL